MFIITSLKKWSKNLFKHISAKSTTPYTKAKNKIVGSLIHGSIRTNRKFRPAVFVKTPFGGSKLRLPNPKRGC